MHISLILFLFFHKDNNPNVILQKGISSLSINTHISSTQNKQKIDKQNKDLLLTLTSDFFLPLWEQHHQKPKNSQNIQMSTKKLQGILNKKAEWLAANQGPEYPYMARKMKFEGLVTLKIEILPDGKTNKITLIKSSGYRILDESAINAAKTWFFKEISEYKPSSSLFITKNFKFKMGQ